MYPAVLAVQNPDGIAYVMAETGEQLTFGQLDALSSQLAHLLRARGVAAGDSILLFLPNGIAWPVAVAAGMRTGLLVTPVNWHLGRDELRPIFEQADPAVVVTTTDLVPVVAEALCDRPGDVPLVLTVDEAPAGAEHLWTALDGRPTSPVPGELLGARVLFSGGTTGRPKAYRQPLLGIHPLDAPPRHPALADRLGIRAGIRFLSTAPSYHAAPFTFQLMTLGAGGTVVCMESFDAERALTALREHDVTHSQWVPTMLSRLLEIPDRDTQPLASTHKVAITSGAPCPAALKDAINDWWGDILHEYYGASEGYGHTYISPAESRLRRGSVGRPLGEARVRIVDSDGTLLPSDEVGRVCFEQATSDGPVLKSMGDMGRLDDDGYLYLTGRASFMIISGGVNIYPEEIEEALAQRPEVRDVAVFGVPHPDFGEQVMAVVELADGVVPGPELEEALTEYCRNQLARYKTPRVFDFVSRLPRLPTGKLNKAALKQGYLQERTHD